MRAVSRGCSAATRMRFDRRSPRDIPATSRCASDETSLRSARHVSCASSSARCAACESCEPSCRPPRPSAERPLSHPGPAHPARSPKRDRVRPLECAQARDASPRSRLPRTCSGSCQLRTMVRRLARSDRAPARSAGCRATQELASRSRLETVDAGFGPRGAGRETPLPKAVRTRRGGREPRSEPGVLLSTAPPLVRPPAATTKPIESPA